MKLRTLFLLIFLLTFTYCFADHFIPVFSNNPYHPMNFYITSASIDGINLEANDEIGIFDGDICVGMEVLNGEIIDYLSIIASEDEPSTPQIDGFLSGNNYSFRLWNSSQNLEISQISMTIQSGNTNFSSYGSAVVAIAGSTGALPPIAEAGINQIVDENSFVLLDGSASYDPSGNSLSFLWEAPEGIILDNCNSMTPSFTAPFVYQETEFQIVLTVNNGTTSSNSDAVTITVLNINNPPEIINEIPDFDLMEDFSEVIEINLDDFFTDNDGDILTFEVIYNEMEISLFQNENLISINSIPNWNGVSQLIIIADDGFSWRNSRDQIQDNFNINITPVNDPPEIISFFPSELSMTTDLNSNIIFTVNAIDIDSEIEYSWLINNVLQNSNENFLSVFFDEEGDFEVKIELNDEDYQMEIIWNISVEFQGLIPYGDIDESGEVNLQDAVFALQYTVNLDPLPLIDPLPWENWRLLATDVDGNDFIQAFDASLISQYAIGLITQFPVEQSDLYFPPVCDVIINQRIDNNENLFLDFYATGDLFGFEISCTSTKFFIQNPIINSDIFWLKNQNRNNSKIALFSAIPFLSDSAFLSLPLELSQIENEELIEFEIIRNSQTYKQSISLKPYNNDENIQTQSDNFTIYPNPLIISNNNFRFNIHINYNLSKDDDICFEIYNIKGQQVLSSGNFVAKKGNNFFSFDSIKSSKEVLSNGIYFIIMKTSKNIFTEKFLILK